LSICEKPNDVLSTVKVVETLPPECGRLKFLVGIVGHGVYQFIVPVSGFREVKQLTTVLFGSLMFAE
jgi:hypothetical protein